MKRITIISFLSAMGIGLVVLAIGNFKLVVLRNSDPASIALISLELLGLGVLGFAIYEFFKSQEKPKLELWAMSFHAPIPSTHDVHDIFSKKEIYFNETRNKQRAYELVGTFDLFLINQGNVPAEFIKLSFKGIGEYRPENKFVVKALGLEPGIKMVPPVFTYLLIGTCSAERDFIVHSLPVDRMPEEVDYALAKMLGNLIGRFEISIEYPKGQPPDEAIFIEAKLQCLRAKMETVRLQVVISESLFE